MFLQRVLHGVFEWVALSAHVSWFKQSLRIDWFGLQMCREGFYQSTSRSVCGTSQIWKLTVCTQLECDGGAWCSGFSRLQDTEPPPLAQSEPPWVGVASVCNETQLDESGQMSPRVGFTLTNINSTGPVDATAS